MKLCWRGIRPSFLKYNPKTTAIPEIIPVVLICTAGIISAPSGCIPSLLFSSTGIISAGRMHLYLALLLHRDYFRRPDASLSCSFAPQGLFPPAKCISIFLFCPTGIISAGRIHPQLALFFHRDYFCRPNASLSSSFLPQRLFCPGRMHLYLALLLHRDYFAPAGYISIFLFCSTGIISAAQIHPQLALLFHRDYFGQPNASLSCSFLPQGLFRPAGCISIFLFCFTGIISVSRIHPQLALFFHRDYFGQPDASLPSSFVPQGLFCPGRMHLYLPLLLHRDYFRRSDSSPACSFAPQGLFCSGRMHLYLPLLLHRDYFHRPDASLSCSFVTQGLFPPPGFIPSLLFCSTGIISASRMHLYLAFFFHRDYFRRPNTSLSSSFASQGLFRPTRCISIFLFCSTGIISTGQMHL